MSTEDSFITDAPLCTRFTDLELRAYFRADTDPILVANINQHAFFGGCRHCFERLNYWGRYANQPANNVNTLDQDFPTNPSPEQSSSENSQNLDPQLYNQFSRNVLSQISRVQKITSIVSQQQLQVTLCNKWDSQVLAKFLANQLPTSEYATFLQHLRQCQHCAQRFWQQLPIHNEKSSS
jgi:hypothetical protein